MQDYHIPVMLSECLEAMQIQPEGCYVDMTFGGGGHSRVILERLQGKGQLYSVDQDPDAIANFAPNPCHTFIASNFRYTDRFLDYYGQLGQVDAVLADLGVSSHQLDTAERGFSFRAETPLLDMRMNTRSGRSARELIAEVEEAELARIIYEYGELRQSRQIARRIVQAREEHPLRTIGDLVEVIRPILNPREEKKQLSQFFQALRIEINSELAALQEMLEACKRILRPGGRLVIMTYHSLEDRIVKRFLKGEQDDASPEQQIYGAQASEWQIVTRKPITPSSQELAENPRSRSAKLRVAVWR